ncbi:unnamed protein product [Chilo suppressalis]|uniref:CCHC-type domain-containing protein n=1 Tax=Chilo suppressalis TaxID=168631 RepID=A0ABN8B0A0_CHISP|nr:unnamed protein product [Chilo suppressalis]
MTRFARAKGSKASNEKAPEDGTPWEVMKEQLLQSKKENDESKKREEAEKQRLENYQTFLKEQKTQKRKATWCEFPETEKAKVAKLPSKKKKSKEDISKSEATENKNSNETSNNITDMNKKQKKKKKKMNKNENNSITLEVNVESSSKKNKKSKATVQGETEDNNSNKVNINEASTNATEKSNQTNQHNKSIKNQKKKKKLLNGQPVRRKEINDNSFELIINGKQVELIRFDGFPIMKKDAERLQELKNNMIKKGIPKSEVQRTMKLERRRAEKALSRLKRDVCYNCRKGGHNLSDCPDLKSKIPGVDAADGVCFKCGSTEHKQFECKVQKDMEFKFATCFICRQPGHIARQCPDNPKGLYPNGGGCKLCGDVTHLRKDCPTANTTKAETSIKLQTLDSDNNIEDIGQQGTVKTQTESGTRKPKKIKF